MDINAIEPPDPKRPNLPDSKLPDSEPPNPEPILHTINYSTIYYPYNPD